VHALRKRCKELRYLLEVFRPLCANAPHRRLLSELKALQDTLGDFQDGEVQREAVREFAAAMMGRGGAAKTVLAMGELAAQLDAHQLGARAALAGRLQPFLLMRIGPSEGTCALMKIYATYNIKGGVGKTSAAVNLAHLAARSGDNVLLWISTRRARQRTCSGCGRSQGRRPGSGGRHTIA